MHRLVRYGSHTGRARIGCALLAATALAGAAQTAPPLRGGLQISSTLDPIARSAADDADAVELVLSVEFTNTSQHVIDAVRITSPVPPDVRYVAGSATGPGSDVLFSVDQGQTFGQPDELKVVGADGVARAAEPADYTHVRFVLDAPLDAGALGLARFRVVPR
jgi:uncharacterized repeat protein (TIGR01451 family)